MGSSLGKYLSTSVRLTTATRRAEVKSGGDRSRTLKNLKPTVKKYSSLQPSKAVIHALSWGLPGIVTSSLLGAPSSGVENAMAAFWIPGTGDKRVRVCSTKAR